MRHALDFLHDWWDCFVTKSASWLRVGSRPKRALAGWFYTGRLEVNDHLSQLVASVLKLAEGYGLAGTDIALASVERPPGHGLQFVS